MINAEIMFGSSKITDIGSVTPNPAAPNAPLVSFPVDLAIPLFQDDFNRPDELLTTNPKWTSFMGYSGFISNQEIGTDIGGAYLVPSKPVFFPNLDKMYLESSIKMDGTSNQFYAILPYSDLTNFTGAFGCIFYFQSGSLVISAGDFAGTPTVLATLNNYPAESTSYVGCEADRTTGAIKAYLNSNLIGKLEGLSFPVGDLAPFMYAQGTGEAIDDVKAFNSFEEGRTLNGGNLRIYNTPYATYYKDQLSNFYLQGYCADNGATVQVKDLAPNTFQSAIAVCASNRFTIHLDMSDLTRFPVGANKLRVEYVSAGNTEEYFWDFVKSNSSIGPEAATIAYVTKWKTDNQVPNGVPGFQTTTDTQIQLPLVEGGIYNFSVDWGDGTTDTISAWDDPKKIHTYSTAGEYNVSIIGIFTKFGSLRDSGFFTSDPWKLIDVIQWGDNKWRDMSYMFAGSGLTIISASGNPDTSLVKDMSNMFDYAKNFNSPVTFDTSQVRKMYQMFNQATSFNQPVNFNTSKVIDMTYMFGYAEVFNQPVNFDTSNVVSMNQMFYEARAFNQPVNFNTSNVTNMRAMFTNAVAFNQPVNFDTANVTDMNYMFSGAQSFNQLINFDSSHVTGMERMFWGALVFNQPVSLDTRSVTTMKEMFSDAPAFNQPVNFDTSNVTTMEGMFHAWGGLSAFNSSITFSNTSNVTSFRSMFENAVSFNKPVNFDTSGATDMFAMFANTPFNQSVNFNTSNVNNMGGMFHSASAFNQPVNFDTSNVTDMWGMFAGATSFNQPINFDTSNVQRMAEMFYNAASFDQNLNFNTAQVYDMGYMFYGAAAFNRNLTGWIVSPNVSTCGSFNYNANPAWTQIPNFSNCNPN